MREKVIAEAKTWQGTPFRDSARIKGTGVDCGQYVCAVFEAVGLAPHIVTPRYNLQFMLNRSDEWYIETLLQYSDEISASEAKMGDVVVLKWGRCYSHGAILAEPWPGLMWHALNGFGVGICDAKRDGRIQAALQKQRAFPPRFFRARGIDQGE
jgi:cell wall-associated NlpC family hydrolase